MQTTRAITALSALLILTGCGSPGLPALRPVSVTVHKIRPCGMFRYERRGGKLILDYKVARCLKRAMRQCAEDRKKLIVANRANVRQIEALNAKEN